MTSLSIKWRISLWISAVLITVITAICIVSYHEFEESQLRSMAQTLTAMANGIITTLDTISNKDKWAEEVKKVTGVTEKHYSSLYRIWFDGASEDLLVSSASDSKYRNWLHKLDEQNMPSIEKSNFFDIGVSPDGYRAIWVRHKINGDIVNIVVANSSRFAYRELYEFLRLLIVLGAGLILSSVIAIAWTVRCGLLPIYITAERLQDITYPRIRQVIYDSKKVPKELNPFIQALNDMLERLDRVLQQQKQFTSDAAHELRTPLSLAKSTLQAAQMHIRQSDDYRQTIDDSLEDIARMEYLIEQLLILARLDEVKHDSNTGEVQLDILLSELSESYDKKLKRTGGKVIFEKSPDITIQGNLDELIRLFSNVLDNAVKYGPENGTISISLKTEPDGYVTINIHDEGGQIPLESIPHIFDRFYRVDPSRSKNTGGAGLGLAISREIALRHNGDISITSSPENGTLVTIKLAR